MFWSVVEFNWPITPSMEVYIVKCGGHLCNCSIPLGKLGCEMVGRTELVSGDIRKCVCYSPARSGERNDKLVYQHVCR